MLGTKLAPLRNIVIAGGIAISIVVLVVYASALKAGFRLVDDYFYLRRAATLPLPEYLMQISDPLKQGLNFRPVHGILIFIEYNWFGAEPIWYHIVQILFHIVNAVLVWGIVSRLSSSWRAGLLSAFVYALFPVTTEAVFWISDQSPLATIFCLSSILLWVIYLQGGSRLSYVFAVVALALAFGSRESSVVLPFALFLIDRMLVRNKTNLLRLGLCYLPIVALLVVYLFILYLSTFRGAFVTVGRYSIGDYILSNYLEYFAMLIFQRVSDLPFESVIVLAIGLLYFIVAFLRRSVVLVFLFLAAVLGIGPVVLNPIGVGPRYAYLAAVPVAAFWGLVVKTLSARWNWRWFGFAASSALMFSLLLNTAAVFEAVDELAEQFRQLRVPYRDVIRANPTFPPNSLLFFIDPPHDVPITDVQGMLYLQYKDSISVWGTYPDGKGYTAGILATRKANLRDYPASFVYYFDETGRAIQVKVDKDAILQTNPTLPADFDVPIRLEGFEVTSSSLKRGDSLVILLYWRAIGRIDKDYTVFVHVVNANGEIIAGDDSMPRSGKDKTSDWYNDRLTADGHVVVIPQDAAIGKGYHLEVGLYYLPTMERLPMTNPLDNALTDHIVIEPFEVVE